MSLRTDMTSPAHGRSPADTTTGSLPCIVPVKYRRTSDGISVVVRGSGTPVFLMHGIGGNADSCAALARELASAGYLSICWDAPGYGKSEDPKDGINHADVAREVLAELGISKAHFIGTSWGGVIATQLAIAHPEMISSMVLMDSTRGSGRTAEGARGMLARLPELESIGAEAFAEKRAARLVSPQAPDEVAAAVRRDMAQIRPAGYGAAAQMMANTDTSAELQGIAVPTLVLVGEHDIITGIDESKALAQAIPDAEFARITNAGHAAIQEKPNAVAALILQFWKKLP